MTKRILVIDNETDMHSILRLILTRHDYEIVEATSGQQGLDILRQSVEPGSQPIDLVLLDIMMPDLSGIDVCQAIRKMEPFATLPIMMLTALSSTTDRLLAFDAGADDYLVKPVDHRELLARVQIQLRLREAERDVRRRNRELVSLHAVADTLSRSTDTASMLRHTLAVTCDVLQVDMGAIYLVDWKREVARLALARGVSPAFEQNPGISEMKVGEPIVGQVAATGQAVTSADLDELPRPNVETVRREGLKSAAFIPIRDEVKVVGVMIVGTKKSRVFHSEEIVLLETIGSQLGGAMARARLHQEAQAARDEARFLARRIVRIQEDERRSIARELHDQLGQAATALLLDLELLRDSLGPDNKELDARLVEDIGVATSLLSKIQTLSLELRPAVLDDLGLEPALRWYVDRFSQRVELAITLNVEGIGERHKRLPEEVETVAFRCLQEILTNVARHARATNVEIEVARHGNLFSLIAKDDGIGFDVEEALRQNDHPVSLGLRGTQERVALVGGICRFQSEQGKGTQVTIEIPLPGPTQDSPSGSG